METEWTESIGLQGEPLRIVMMGLFTFIGAFVLYVINRLQKKQPFSLLEALNVDVRTHDSKPVTILTDMIVSSLLGSILVVAIVSPTTIAQAVAAGLGLTGLLSTLATDIGESRDESRGTA